MQGSALDASAGCAMVSSVLSDWASSTDAFGDAFEDALGLGSSEGLLPNVFINSSRYA